MSVVEDRVADIIFKTPDFRREAIKASTRFQEDLDADSLEVVELIMSVEDKFDIEVLDEKAEALRTVGVSLLNIPSGREIGLPMRATVDDVR